MKFSEKSFNMNFKQERLTAGLPVRILKLSKQTLESSMRVDAVQKKKKKKRAFIKKQERKQKSIFATGQGSGVYNTKLVNV